MGASSCLIYINDISHKVLMVNDITIKSFVRVKSTLFLFSFSYTTKKSENNNKMKLYIYIYIYLILKIVYVKYSYWIRSQMVFKALHLGT